MAMFLSMNEQRIWLLAKSYLGGWVRISFSFAV
jgi:hypothetical protein